MHVGKLCNAKARELQELKNTSYFLNDVGSISRFGQEYFSLSLSPIYSGLVHSNRYWVSTKVGLKKMLLSPNPGINTIGQLHLCWSSSI